MLASTLGCVQHERGPKFVTLLIERTHSNGVKARKQPESRPPVEKDVYPLAPLAGLGLRYHSGGAAVHRGVNISVSDIVCLRTENINLHLGNIAGIEEK